MRFAVAAFALTLASAAVAAPLNTTIIEEDIEARQAAVTQLTTAQISVFRPYAFYAATAYCAPATTLAWNCGSNCAANPTFTPLASGGNGATEQYYYVGYDSTLQSIVVGRQGTDFSKILPAITDANFFLDDLSTTLFPGVSSSVKAHDGFTDSQAISGPKILAAVRTGISRFGATKIAVVGHSLGGALATLDGLYLSLNIPTATVSIYTFSAPRVGNQAFVDLINSKFPSRVQRVTNRDDPVPILPGRFLGFAHVVGERRIQEDGTWYNCPGQDNTNTRCTTGAVPNIFVGDTSDHSGPFTGTGVTTMGC